MDYTIGDTIDVKFTTRSFTTGQPTTLAGTPVISAYPDNSITQLTGAFITLTVDFDGLTGLHNIRVVATVGNGFAAGSTYYLVITTGTVGGVSVVGEVVGEFTLGRSAAFARLGAPVGSSVSADVAAVKVDTAATLIDTAEIGVAGAGLTNINLPNQTMDIVGSITGNLSGSVGSVTGHTAQTGDSFARLGLPAGASVSADVAAVKVDTAAILVDTGTTLDTKINDIQGATFSTVTDSLEAIRDRGDAAWTTGAGGSDRLLMVDTTIATLSTQTSFTLTAGSADDDAYNNCTIVVEDVATATQKAVGLISDYVGLTKTVTLLYDPAVFIMAATDKVYILAENALKATLANRQLNVAADGDLVEVNTLTGHTAQTGDSFARLGAPAGASTSADIADVPTVAEFNARTLAAASYFDPAVDTVANVTTVTTLSGHTAQTGDNFARLGAPAGVSVSADVAAVKSDTAAILTDTGTTLDTKINDIQGATFSSATDSLEAIRDRGDAAWTTGAGGSDRLLLADTTIATLTTQTSFTLTAGSADNDAYNNCTIVVEDVATATQKSIGMVLDYVGVSKTVTLKEALAFTIAATDKVYILAENSLKSTIANRQLDVTATGGAGIDWGNVENPTTAVDLSATDIQLADTVTTLTGHTAQTGDSFARLGAPAGLSVSADIADVPTVAEFNARTILQAAYFDPAADTVANVTTVATLTGHTAQTGDNFARLGAPAGVSVSADVAAVKADTAAILIDTGTTLDTKINDIQGATFSSVTDSLEAIRDRGDAAWTTGAGGSDRLLMVDTTIATLATQTSFTLTSGSADNGAYNNCTIVIEDVATATQKAVGLISNYVGLSKTVTLLYDPAVFTIAATDKVYILAENALKATLANRQLNVAADGDLVEVNTLTGHTAQTGDNFARLGAPAGASVSADIADLPTVAEFNARTLVAAAYFDAAADTVANVATVATLTGHTAQTGDNFARLGAPAGASVSADIATVKADTAAILLDTAVIGAAGAGLTDLGGMSVGMKAEVNAEVDTALITTTYAEPGQGLPPATASIADKVGYTYKAWRNKVEQTSTQFSLYDDAGTTIDQKSTVSDDAVTFTKGEIASGP